jgi:glycosyltransferase 2 family protein
LKQKRWVLGAVVGIALIVLILLARNRIHFSWHIFGQQLRQADPIKFAIGIAMIYLAYGFRAARWSLFLKPVKRVGPFATLASQVIGFTGVALFGRLADLVRPYLIARRVQLSVGSQVAVYTVERMFDMGSMALIFAFTLLLAPDRDALPHHELLGRVAAFSLLASVALAVFAAVVRWSGNAIANAVERGLGVISKKIALSVANKIRSFRDGLNTLSSFGDFVLALGMSLIMWAMITFAYLETTRAFVASKELAGMTLAKCMVLMAASMGGSIVQLPVVGWFTQIGVTTVTMQKLFGVAPEPALGAGAMLLVVTFMSIIPVGLIWARFEHVSLKKIAEESEHAEEQAADGQAAVVES